MPTWMEHPNRPGRFEGEANGFPTEQQCKEMHPELAHLNNERYARLMGDYLACTT